MKSIRLTILSLLVFSSIANAQSIDEAWNSSPSICDAACGQSQLAGVSPGISSSGNYKISTYRGDWGSSADFGWHHWCALTAHTANGDRGTGWNIYPASFDASTGKSWWQVTYYNLSSWGATCYDVLP